MHGSFRKCHILHLGWENKLTLPSSEEEDVDEYPFPLTLKMKAAALSDSGSGTPTLVNGNGPAAPQARSPAAV